ncbi:MAG TPA: hypothetical protein VMM12_17840 [Longimicrobiales bacterium]|nr:hypothetical protein [Longimicrobiales bacterium]
MRFPALLGLLALAAPLAAALPAPVAAQGPAARGMEQVRVTARIVVVDRDAFTRAGLAYAVIGNDRVVVRNSGRQRAGGARVKVGTHGVAAFLEAVRESRWVRSETTQQVLAMSGRPALVSSQDLAIGRRAARTRGPTLSVIPTVLEDGLVHLQVSTGIEDRVSWSWGYGVDGSPAAVETELLARDGEEVLLASSTSTQTTRESGLLSWSAGEEGRDVLVAVSVAVVR